MSIPEQPCPETEAWERFTRALILERYGRTCPERSRQERAEEAVWAAYRNAILAERHGEADRPALKAV